MTSAIPFSVLDLCPVPQGSTPADAFRNSLNLAQHAENWGYPPPIGDIDAFCPPAERAGVDYALTCSVIGGPDAVERGLASFIAAVLPDELMITANLYSHAARLRSYEIVAQIRDRLQ